MARIADRDQAKKLTDAARHWAGGGVKDEMAADLAVMGADQSIIDAVLESSPTPDFEVLEENWPAVSMFMRLQTQWIVGGMGAFIGLNYQSVEFLFRIEGIEDQRELLADLQVMELAALQGLNTKD